MPPALPSDPPGWSFLLDDGDDLTPVEEPAPASPVVDGAARAEGFGASAMRPPGGPPDSSDSEQRADAASLADHRADELAERVLGPALDFSRPERSVFHVDGRRGRANPRQEAAFAALGVPPPAVAAPIALAARCEDERALPICGWRPPGGDAFAPLADALARCRIDDPTDEEVHSIAQRLFEPRSGALLKDDAKALQVNPKKVRRVERLLASTMVLMERHLRRSFEESLVQAIASDEHRILYLDYSSSDETPLTVRQIDYGPNGLPSTNGAPPQNPPPDPTALAQAVAPGIPRSSHTAVGKLFQSFEAFAVLVRMPSGRVLMVTGANSNWMQILERTTGEALAQANALSTGVTQWSNTFKHKWRVTCVDGATSNARAEQEITRRRGDGWQLLLATCEAHLAAGCHGKVSLLVAEPLSQMVHTALSIRSGSGATALFRACVRQVVSDRLRLCHGAPSEGALRYRDGCVRLFLSRCEHKSRKAILDMLANGDWRKTDSFEVYVDTTLAEEPEDHRQRWLDANLDSLIWALLPTQPPLYNQHRWFSADSSVDSMGLLHSCHNLLQAAFPLFCARIRMGPSPAAPAAANAEAHGASARAPPESDEGAEVMALVGGPGQDAAQQAANAFSKDNERHRSIGLSFVGGNGPFVLPLFRVVLAPLAKLLRAVLFAGSAAWEAEQRLASANAPPSSPNAPRRFRIELAAAGSLESDFFEEIRKILGDPLVFEAVHPFARTRRAQGLAFRLLSKAGAVVHDRFREHHELGPCVAFRLLSAESALESIRSVPACCRHDFTNHVLAALDGGCNLGDMRLMLSCVGSLTRLDIANIEIGHGRLRRRILQTSNGTWRALIDNASASWVLQESDRRRREFELLCGRLPSRRQSVVEGAGSSTAPGRKRAAPLIRRGGRNPQRSGGGGAYRAFIRREGLNMFDGEAARRYRELSEADRAALKVEGLQMRAAHRARVDLRLPRMGVSRQVERGVKRDLAAAALEDIQSAPAGAELAIVPLAAAAPRGDVAGILSRARQELALRRRAQKEEGDRAKERLASIEAQRRPPILQAMAQLFGPGFTFDDGDLLAAAPAFPEVDVAHLTPDTRTMATALIGKALQSPHRFKGFLDFLEAQWAKNHKTVLHSEGKAIEVATARPSTCQRARCCLCDGFGLLLKRFVALWCVFFKGRVTKGLGRQMVDHGHLVCGFACAPAVGAGGRESDSSSSAALEAGVATNTYFHIAHTSWSPFMVFFQVLRYREQNGPYIVLEATGEWMSMFVALRSVDFEGKSCVATLYKVVESDELLPSLRQSEVWVEKLVMRGEACDANLWPPSRAARGARKWRPRVRAPRPASASSGGAGAAQQGRGNDALPDGPLLESDGELEEAAFADAAVEADPACDDGFFEQMLEEMLDDLCMESGEPILPPAGAGVPNGAVNAAAEEELASPEPAVDFGLGGDLPSGAAVEDNDTLGGEIVEATGADADVGRDGVGAVSAEDALVADGGAGAAASSADGGGSAPAAPPPAALDGDGAAVARLRKRGRTAPELVAVLPNGSITYYQLKNTFVADCELHGKHPKCCRTRTAAASAAGGAQGRPLGFLYAYLKHHGGPEVKTPAEHYRISKALSFEDRAAARAEFETMPGAEAFLAKERPRRPDEGPEPAGSVA